MAKLPYTFTICPDEPNPKQFTASCTEIGLLLQNSPDGDLTIKNNVSRWDSWSGGSVRNAVFEELLQETLK